jgi:hypothetical protein
MQIKFQRSGGFANIPLRAELDTAQMPPERAQELERLIEKARAFDQPAQPTAMPVPDDLHYELTIQDNDQSHSFRISDSAASNDLKLLFDFLGEEALKKLRQHG